MTDIFRQRQLSAEINWAFREQTFYVTQRLFNDNAIHLVADYGLRTFDLQRHPNIKVYEIEDSTFTVDMLFLRDNEQNPLLCTLLEYFRKASKA